MQNGRNEDYIVDVQISFDSVKSVERARAEKIQKYSSLIAIHLKNTNRTLYIIPLVIGSLGGIPEITISSIEIILDKKQTWEFLSKCSALVIKESKRIYD
ncbi:hypothetical protein HZS_1165, partial [Henneguya salminicola]